MKKQSPSGTLFDSNMLVVFCVLFTISIITEAILNSIVGAAVYLRIEFVIWLSVFLSAPLLPLSVFKYLWKYNYIGEKDYLFWAGIPLQYLISCGLIMFYTFIQGFFEPQRQGIYLFRFTMYTIMFVVLTIGAIVIDLIQTATDNENLRKIHASQGDAK